MIHNSIRYAIFVLFGSVLAMNTPLVRAQDAGNAIEYGQTVSGEITNKAFEVNYTFKGDVGDVLVIQMARDGYPGGLEQPQILLLNSDGGIVADTTKSFPLSTIVLPTKLPAKGDYTIVGTRYDGRAGKSVGKFTLTLLKPDKLISDTPMQGKASYGLVGNIPTMDSYYLVEAAGPFQILYQKQNGTMNPEVSVNVIKDNELQSVASLAGEELSSGTLGILAQPNAIYIVKVGHQLLGFSEGEADFTITLTGKK